MDELTQLRAEIDRIDRTLVAALNERGRIARKIGLYKKARKLPVFDASRETALLEKLRQLNTGGISENALLQIYHAILTQSRKIQEDL